MSRYISKQMRCYFKAMSWVILSVFAVSGVVGYVGTVYNWI